VWAQLADVRRHADWMADARAIRLIDEEPGLGQRFECDTRIGPLRLTDRMEITAWEPPSTMGVRHTGLVTGEGRFTLTPIDLDRRTRFSWGEALHFPWWLGGRVGAVVAGPVLRRIWRHNLSSLKAQIER
jgi:Polyketide cyclase / dehydrase and lipid transport